MGQHLLLILKQHHIQRFHFIGHTLGGFIDAALAYLCQSSEYQMLSINTLNGWDTLHAHTYKCFESRINLLTCAGTEAHVKAHALFLYLHGVKSLEPNFSKNFCFKLAVKRHWHCDGSGWRGTNENTCFSSHTGTVLKNRSRTSGISEL